MSISADDIMGTTATIYGMTCQIESSVIFDSEMSPESVTNSWLGSVGAVGFISCGAAYVAAPFMTTSHKVVATLVMIADTCNRIYRITQRNKKD